MILIDVRTKEEYDNNHIDNALHHDVMDMMQGIYPDIDKNEKIVLYCQTGNRSMTAKNLMENAGFKNVTNGGGMKDLVKNLD